MSRLDESERKNLSMYAMKRNPIMYYANDIIEYYEFLRDFTYSLYIEYIDTLTRCINQYTEAVRINRRVILNNFYKPWAYILEGNMVLFQILERHIHETGLLLADRTPQTFKRIIDEHAAEYTETYKLIQRFR